MSRLEKINKEKYLPEETGVIILGDAGLNLYLNKTDKKNKKIINNTGFQIYCLRGNHEERPENIPNMKTFYDEEILGNVYREDEYLNIHYLIDGEKYKMGEFIVLAIGGAYSVDKWHILSKSQPGASWTGWFPEEQLTSEEMIAIQNKHQGEVFDFILTHTCPYDWRPEDLFLYGINQETVDTSMEKWLNDFKGMIEWGVWCWGHYHADRIERPRCEMFYQDIQDMKDIWNRWYGPRTFAREWWLHVGPNFYKEKDKWKV